VLIAVSGTDAREKLFPASNRGNHNCARGAGRRRFPACPDGKYRMTSGTSFSAAYVSGIAALLLEHNPALRPNDVRTILTGAARDLGAPRRSVRAGEADVRSRQCRSRLAGNAGGIGKAYAGSGKISGRR
jgi:Subtilase family